MPVDIDNTMPREGPPAGTERQVLIFASPGNGFSPGCAGFVWVEPCRFPRITLVMVPEVCGDLPPLRSCRLPISRERPRARPDAYYPDD
jgi:hypothetical protein